MRVGYPCINLSITNPYRSTFKLASYSENKLKETVEHNLQHLFRILQFNLDNGIYFFRISSDLIPFASHPVCKFDWSTYFKSEFQEIGNYILRNNIRVSMHPDQFVVLNSKDDKIVQNSIRELDYHCSILNSMELNNDAKIQIHVGGAYGDKKNAIDRFVYSYEKLNENLKKRVVIENDDRIFSLKDCININTRTGIPIILDIFHHECLYNGESIEEAIVSAASTWMHSSDGNPILDYSSQSNRERKGKHAPTLDKSHFTTFITKIEKLLNKSKDVDIMLEIKDKEKSAFAAIHIVRHLMQQSIIRNKII